MKSFEGTVAAITGAGSGDGHVINTSSLFGIIAMPTQGAYNARKFAVRGYTEALRMELEMKGVTVSATCVHPRGVATNIAAASRIEDNIKMQGRRANRPHAARPAQAASSTPKDIA